LQLQLPTKSLYWRRLRPTHTYRGQSRKKNAVHLAGVGTDSPGVGQDYDHQIIVRVDEQSGLQARIRAPDVQQFVGSGRVADEKAEAHRRLNRSNSGTSVKKLERFLRQQARLLDRSPQTREVTGRRIHVAAGHVVAVIPVGYPKYGVGIDRESPRIEIRVAARPVRQNSPHVVEASVLQ